MGDPRKQRSKYRGPSHPWKKDRIVEESEFVKAYGLKNKSEIYRANSFLKRYLHLAKRFATISSGQDEIEKAHFLKKLQSFGFIEGDDVAKALDITLPNILERRLQTIVFRKGLARTMTQARQFIIHRHIEVGGKKITMPSYKVTLAEEPKVAFVGSSALAKDDHPERIVVKKEEAEPEKKKPVKEKKVSRKPVKKAEKKAD
jgi:small subunit ribosomal protein S4